MLNNTFPDDLLHETSLISKTKGGRDIAFHLEDKRSGAMQYAREIELLKNHETLARAATSTS